jgi:threonine/homoserine/homoserine lactone efflux protein
MSVSYYWPSLLSVFAASFIAFLSPGPNFVGIVSSAVSNRLNGIFVAIGVRLGTAFWAMMAVTGVTTIINSYSNSSIIMQFIGGSYLIWLSVKSLKGAFVKKSSLKISEQAKETNLKCLQKGLLIQLTNPKTALFWLSMASFVIFHNTPVIVSFILVIGTTLIALSWHIILAVGFSISNVTEFYLKFRSHISLIFGIAFILLGSRLLLWNIAGI